ncbi:FG-GAP repeat domain-containing protein [Microbulbifer sp. JMSA003]|uniref:FG-GAP repeat domain-containing protein n=1 Tax=Microbulbifer sp. JMSA003 TaxID=3243369 RepID=UPI004039C2DA
MCIFHDKPITNTVGIILISSILTACGGGGSSSSDSSGGSGQGGGASNTPPVINSLSITPNPAYNDNVLSVQLDASDEDGDQLEVTYTWKNNNQIISEETESKLAASHFNHGDTISIEAYITDGEDSVSQNTSIIIQNRAPIVESLSFSNLPAFTNTDIEATISISDIDNDPLNIEYYWTVNNEEVSNITTNLLPSTHFLKNDEVAVKVIVSDGELTGEATASTEIQDALPVMSIVNMPDVVQYGIPTAFQVIVEDLDNDPYNLDFLARPNGMEIDEEGNINWTPTGPMFDKEMDVQWEVSLFQEDYSHSESRVLKVVDAEREIPLSNGYIEISHWPNDVAIGDIDGDGIKEIVATNGERRLYAFGSNGKEYAIKWEYPYLLTSGEEISTKRNNNYYISSLTFADLNNDGKEELLAGLEGDFNQSHDTTGLFLFDNNLKPKRVATLTGNEIEQVSVTDLNNDQSLEIIVLVDIYTSYDSEPGDIEDQMQLVILNSDDYSVKWQSEALQLGEIFAVGNLDGDSELEIVLGGGYVFDYIDGNYALSWHYEDGFTDADKDNPDLDIIDIDMDGIGEIISIHPTSGFLTLFDANTQAIKIENEVKTNQFTTFLSPEDTTLRILATENSVGRSQLYSFDIDAQEFIPEWNSRPSAWGDNMRVANLDSDPELEYFFGNRDEIKIYSDLSGDEDLELEWEIGINMRDLEEKLVDIKSKSADSSKISALSLGEGVREDPHIMSLNPDTNIISFSSAIPEIENKITAGIMLDLQNDSTEKFAFVNEKTPGLYDIFSESIVWSGSPMSEEVVALTAGQLGSDDKTSMIATTKDASIYAYDMDSYELLWSHDVGGGIDIKLVDIDNNGLLDVVSTDTETISLFTSDDDYQSISAQFNIHTDIPEGQGNPNSKISQLSTGDLDGDSIDEVIILMEYYSKAWIIVVNSSLEFKNLTSLEGYDVRSIVVQNYGTSHRNLLLNVENNELHYIVEMDPWTGKIISTSPELGPMMVENSLRFIDSNNDGIYELGWLTEEGSINITR